MSTDAMMNVPPHSYGPGSLPAYGVRHHIRIYLIEADKCKALGMPIARRACIQTALLIRAEWRNARTAD